MLRVDRISIIDLEATCWEDEEYQVENSEIIEIGCALLDTRSKKIVDNRSIYVKPESKQPLSRYCFELTGITDTILRKRGKSLGAAVKELKRYYPVSRLWMSWGGYDPSFLLKECTAKGVPFPFKIENHMDAGVLFRLLRGVNKDIGLIKAMEMVGLSFEGKQHSGKDDAYNTARLIRELIS